MHPGPYWMIIYKLEVTWVSITPIETLIIPGLITSKLDQSCSIATYNTIVHSLEQFPDYRLQFMSVWQAQLMIDLLYCSNIKS